MAENRCSSASDVVGVGRAEKLLTQPPGTKANEPDKEVTYMPFEHDMGQLAHKDNTGIPDQLHFRSDQWDDACSLVERYHYSRRVPSNVQLVGSLHESGGLFGDSGPMVAACFFSIPPTRWGGRVLELSRLVRADKQVPLSSLISQSATVLKSRGERLLVSFADKTQGHEGGVYRAASWLYAGCRKRSMDGVIYEGLFIPGRSASSRWGTRSPKKLAELGVMVQPHYDEGKHLYFKPLGVAGKTRAKRLGLKSIKYAARPEDEQVSNLCEAGVTPAGRSNIQQGAV